MFPMLREAGAFSRLVSFLSRVPPPDTIGPEFDHLAAEAPKLRPCSSRIAPTRRAAVVATMRNEGILILEWVAHYRVLGFDSIIIYTNDNDDGSDELLLALHKAGVIKLVWNIVPDDRMSQWKAYRHAFWHSTDVAEHEWVAFLDADEFLIPLLDGKIANINDYISYVISKYDCSAVCLRWRWFAGDRAFQRQPGLLFERYPNFGGSNHVKTLFRLRDAESIRIHNPDLKKGFLGVDGGGNRLEKLSYIVGPNDGSLGHINHYWNRSFQEFYVKRERGRATQFARLDWTSFFTWGGCSGSLSEHPDAAYIDRVKQEIKSLLRYRGVASAIKNIEDNFKARVETQEVENLYASAKRALTPSHIGSNTNG
jgi:hypothetical protein